MQTQQTSYAMREILKFFYINSRSWEAHNFCSWSLSLRYEPREKSHSRKAQRWDKTTHGGRPRKGLKLMFLPFMAIFRQTQSQTIGPESHTANMWCRRTTKYIFLLLFKWTSFVCSLLCCISLTLGLFWHGGDTENGKICILLSLEWSFYRSS